jgi:hypothetical protein
MGLFSKIKKAFKKVTGAVKKVVKKVVKGVKKVVKKISSSKILKALAIAAAVVVTGGAAVAAFTGGTAASGTFAGWMMNASQAVTGGTLFGTGASGLTGALQTAGNFAAKTVASPFKAIGTTAGNLAAGVTDFTGLTTESSRIGITPEMQTAIDTAQVQAGVSGTGPTTLAGQNQAALEAAKTAGASPETLKALEAMNVQNASSVKPGFWQSGAGEVIKNVGTGVATQVATGAAMQYIQGDPEQQGSMSGAAYEGGDYLDPLKVYAAQQGINTDGIYQHMMYGNADPSSMYGNELYRQATFGVAS